LSVASRRLLELIRTDYKPAKSAREAVHKPKPARVRDRQTKRSRTA
jgi:hypothetical protein